jgi:hypothetical protein
VRPSAAPIHVNLASRGRLRRARGCGGASKNTRNVAIRSFSGVRIVLPLLLILRLLASASAVAQTPMTGFVPPYEIVRTVRAAGFDPLAPPLREGTIYVLRATDFRGILMRVVVDARTGVIRDANRIVPAPGLYGPSGYPAGSYGPGSYGPRGYGPAGYGYGPEIEAGPYGPGTSRPPGIAPVSEGEASADAIPPPSEIPASRIGTPTALPSEADLLGEPPQPQSVLAVIGPPLPRPRPATLVAAKPSQDPSAAAQSVSTAKSGDNRLGDSKPAQPDVASTSPAAPLKSPSAKPAKASNAPAIND